MISLVFAAMMAAAPAADPTPAAPATPAAASPAKKASDPNKMVCKKEEVLGSRMPTRTCMTQAEWDQRKQDSRDVVDAAQRNIPIISH